VGTAFACSNLAVRPQWKLAAGLNEQGNMPRPLEAVSPLSANAGGVFGALMGAPGAAVRYCSHIGPHTFVLQITSRRT
jgi:hypothetical protein